ncbi:MAG: hypothetical protein A3H93_18825 [Rhodocyclales bacterium RIFCSPLOWO2_02_FULL_63_24]|nr:MAG: hypothetical protein A3H93_18825 [Rhodocyclales bacterium RIFCSPLOWO2_02_FULL_63_24]
MTTHESDAAELLLEGDRLRDSGQFDAALDVYGRVTLDMGAAATGYFKLGTTYSRMLRPNEAADAYQQALTLRPDYPEAINNLGLVYAALAEFDDAELLYRGLLADYPDYFDAHINFGNLLMDTGRAGEAQYYFRRTVSMRPDSALAHNRLGAALRNRGRVREAIGEMQIALDRDPDFYPAWNDLGTCYFTCGDHVEADRVLEKSIELNPEQINAWHIWVFVSNFQSLPNDQIFARHKKFGERARAICGPLPQCYPRNLVDPQRRLRVGFVSGDFKRHSVAYFLQAALANLDPGAFELIAYSTTQLEDDMTARLRPYFWKWRDLFKLSDQAAVDLVKSDEVDVLFDLSGHTNHNRLMIFGYKPAPVQVSWLGYPNTTGLDSIDYRLTDDLVDPRNEGNHFYTERLLRLPGPFLCYTPPRESPPVADPPTAEHGRVTFGSFNARVKLGDECIALWSRVLTALPESRLIIKSVNGVDEESARAELITKFAGHGVATGRVVVGGAKDSVLEHLAAYGEIDIALDTVPYNGTTTTCEALWMGVPVITLTGDRHAGRVGSALLQHLGLGQWAAKSSDEFVAKAMQLATDRALLAQLRSTMRERLRSSLLMDGKAMGRNLGDAIRSMWTTYCASGQAAASKAAATVPNAAPSELMRLNFGGRETRDGWKIVDAQAGPHVDFVADLRNLDQFPSGSCQEIYASHVLEHLNQREVVPALRGLHRLLVAGGRLYLAVPDLGKIAWLLCKPEIGSDESFELMRMLFGGQTDSSDFNYIGFCRDFMGDYLAAAGFQDIEPVESFGLFADASEASFAGTRISLNLLVRK